MRKENYKKLIEQQKEMMLEVGVIPREKGEGG